MPKHMLQDVFKSVQETSYLEERDIDDWSIGKQGVSLRGPKHYQNISFCNSTLSYEYNTWPPTQWIKTLKIKCTSMLFSLIRRPLSYFTPFLTTVQVTIPASEVVVLFWTKFLINVLL
jgi:hypothetical protein